MDKKTLIAIITLIVLILLSIGGYFYFSKKKVAPAPPVTTFPGGDSSGPLTVPVEDTGSTDKTETTTAPTSATALPRLYELHKVPVAGVGFYETGNGPSNTIFARYIERGVGHIFETPPSTLVESRIVNETRSRIMEALWGNGGKSVVVRFIDESDAGSIIKTSILNLGAPQSSNTSTSTSSSFIKTEEVYLPDYIPFMATAEDNSDKLFYLERGMSTSIGSSATFKNTGVSTVFSSAFTEWLPQFPNQQLVTLTTRPSASVAGHLFFIDLKTKSVSKIIGGINGLTTLTNRDGKLVLYTETRDGAPELSVYDVAKKTSRSLLTRTLPEKCAWSPKDSTMVYCAVPQTIPTAVYPDQWYQGLITFSDTVVKIDTTTGLTQKIMAPADFGATSLDITSPSVSSNDSYLVFINKVTGTPWMYSFNEVIAGQRTTNTEEIKPVGTTGSQLGTPTPKAPISDLTKIN